MTLKNKDKIALIKYRIEKSQETLKSAKRGFNADDMFDASNRIYYACFYSTEVLMLSKNFSTKKHVELKSEFNRVFVHGGILDKKYYKILGNAFNDRQNSDYGDFVELEDKEYIKMSLKNAEEFITVINKLTLSLIDKEKNIQSVNIDKNL